MRRFILSAVTDSELLPSGTTLLERIELLCRSGVRRIVLREKGMPDRDYSEISDDFVRICREKCVIPVISHRIDMAKDLGTELQLSMDEMRRYSRYVKGLDVCVSVHSIEEAIEAESLGASSLTAGHIFATDCKKGVPERGVGFLKDVVKSVGIPVYAIGGIDLDVIEDVYSAGASGVCLMSTMMNSPEQHISEIVKKCFDINKPIFDKGCLALYAITDSRWLGPKEKISDKVEQAILGGATIVQLREKNADRKRIITEGKECLSVCRSYGVPLIINDDVSIAVEIGADGIHLGQDDPVDSIGDYGGIVGMSAHNPMEANDAFDRSADYIGCGAVFSTSTKGNVSSLGVNGLKEIARTSKLPIVAIGGIDENNIRLLEGTGISGIAVISALFSKDDVKKSSANLRELVREYLNL